MENGKIIQLKLPESVNRKLKILAITNCLTLRGYCEKVLAEHVADK